jgi:hypothetical protein
MSNTPSGEPAYWSNWGRPDGPILQTDRPPAMGVYGSTGRELPVGIAFPSGAVRHRRGAAQTFRLVIGKEELPGRYVCLGRRFVELGEAAE